MGGDDGCTFRVTTATLSSAVLGGAAGATYASFRDVPRVLRSQAMPALVATMGVTGSFAGTFAAVVRIPPPPPSTVPRPGAPPEAADSPERPGETETERG